MKTRPRISHHPKEAELALLAGGEGGFLSQYLLNRHVRLCDECAETVRAFRLLRSEIAASADFDDELAEPDWNRMAAEMRANIHLGLEAGECVRGGAAIRVWNPKMAAAFASLLLLVGAGVVMRAPQRVAPAAPVAGVAQRTAEPVVESTGSGLEIRSGENSMMLLNHHGSVADQTFSAQGVVRASYINAGGVTINNVYLE